MAEPSIRDVVKQLADVQASLDKITSALNIANYKIDSRVIDSRVHEVRVVVPHRTATGKGASKK